MALMLEGAEAQMLSQVELACFPKSTARFEQIWIINHLCYIR
jgi:hypothetical protein